MIAHEQEEEASKLSVVLTVSNGPPLVAQVEYPEIEEGAKPRHRFMSAYEQKKEAWDKSYQYLLFAADPYEVVAFKIPNLEVDRTDRFFSHWCGPASQGARVWVVLVSASA